MQKKFNARASLILRIITTALITAVSDWYYGSFYGDCHPDHGRHLWWYAP